MCGHVGVAGELEFKDEGLMKRLLICDYFRGPDSTGFAALRKTNDTKIVKVASHPIDLFDMKKFVEALSYTTSKAFMGHNRLATLGKVNGLNAHPFQFDHIVGAHNGTLDKASWSRLEEASGIQTDVDSAAIFACIAKIGVVDTLKLMEEGRTGQTGAWALVWFDTEKGTLNFLRNKHRPFWFAYTEDFKKILWASEWEMIRASTDMTPADYPLHISKEGHRFWETAADMWYQIDLTELSKGSSTRPKAKLRTVKGREAPVVEYTGGPFHRYHGTDYPTQETTGTDGRTSTTTFRSNKNPDKTIPKDLLLTTTAKNPYLVVNKKEFDAMTVEGCFWCGGDVAFGEEGVTIYSNPDAVVCPSCAGAGSHISRIHVDTETIVKLSKIAA